MADGGDGDAFPLIYVNSTFLRTTGYDWEEIRGRNCRFLQGPQTDAAAVAAIRTALQSQSAIRIELLNYRKDGTPFRNLLALKFVRSFESEADTAVAAEQRGEGVARYVLGVQFEASGSTVVDARLVQLDALVQMLPCTIVEPRAAALALTAQLRMGARLTPAGTPARFESSPTGPQPPSSAAVSRESGPVEPHAPADNGAAS